MGQDFWKKKYQFSRFEVSFQGGQNNDVETGAFDATWGIKITPVTNAFDEDTYVLFLNPVLCIVLIS